MKTAKRILFACTFLLFLFNGLAQTKPAGTAKKKPAPKEINVFICTNPKDKFVHKRSGCAELSKCGGEIKQIKSGAELKKWKKKTTCKRCLNT